MVLDHETEIREQIGGNPVDFSDGWVQQRQLANPLPGRASHCNVPRGQVKQHETDRGKRDGVKRDRIRELGRENRQLRQANGILRKGKSIFHHWSEDNGRAFILPPLSSPQAATAARWDEARSPVGLNRWHQLAHPIPLHQGSSRGA